MFYDSASTTTGDAPFGRIQYGSCSTGCPTCTCYNPGHSFCGQFVVCSAEPEPSFEFPKLKAEPRRPFYQRINRKPWERG